jgi:ATP-dependent Clp protease ATP-binding subunit ClpA
MSEEKEIQYSPQVDKAIKTAFDLAGEMHHEFATPLHYLLALCRQDEFYQALQCSGANPRALITKLEDSLANLETIPAGEPTPSYQLREMFGTAAMAVEGAEAERIDVPHTVKGILALPESEAAFLLLEAIDGNEGGFMSDLVMSYDLLTPLAPHPVQNQHPSDDGESWRSFVTCVNDVLEHRNPLIGRETELERTIRVLCRKDKNNPLHVGEPGVGKTALVYGLARMINEGNVPESLKNSKVYQLEVGSLLAGTQFRGDFEKRLKIIMDGVAAEKGAIVYIDEIHNLVGAGATGEGSMDASNMLKPYLEAGDIRFIGSTTYEEYNRHFSRSKGLVRRFQQIDIAEPSIDEAINILRQLRSTYEQFHHVTYTDEALEFAVRGSARYLTDRFLPDKAIDLLDEAGAYRQLHPNKPHANELPPNEPHPNGFPPNEPNHAPSLVRAGGPRPPESALVDKPLIAEILAKMCKVDSLAMKEDDDQSLATLTQRIAADIYGQQEAVTQVSEAVMMAKAGLTEEGKPLASLLFVGPTGVGKTEVAKVLAREMDVQLVRFDMSEYTEKHTVAKLIGSPAGYVGYDDGGLLTDAIRKTPNCVLLLDEIEKAHPDIYNILLQVMDYGRLTDNKGRHADFRNVVLIMTSNAGARYAAQASVGFGNTTTAGQAMMKEVKKTFKPEFINRLSGTVIFNDMDHTMAGMILDKKLRQLQRQLDEKHVIMTLSDEARAYILKEGFTKEYGARELDRVIATRLKPLLMRAILFGPLRQGGRARIDMTEQGGQASSLSQKSEQGTQASSLSQKTEQGGQASSLSQKTEQGTQASSLSQKSEQGAQASSLSQKSEQGTQASSLSQKTEQVRQASSLSQKSEQGRQASSLSQKSEPSQIKTPDNTPLIITILPPDE